ncbi:MAG: asparagine synthase-related protein [archaeon]
MAIDCKFKGLIYNKDDLCKKFELDANMSCSDFIKKLYVGFQENIFSELDGSFSFILHDSNKKNDVAFRSIDGNYPLYIEKENKGYKISDTLKDFKGKNINYSALNDIVLTVFTQDYRTVLSGVNFIPENTLIKISGQNMSERKFDVPLVSTNNPQDAFLNIITKHVEAIMKQTEPAILFSGGLDSTLLYLITKKFYPIKAINIINSEDDFSSSKFAKENNVDIIRKKISFRDVLENIDEYVLSSESFDSHFLGQYLALKLVDNNYIFSGFGPEKLLSGYNGHNNPKKQSDKLKLKLKELEENIGVLNERDRFVDLAKSYQEDVDGFYNYVLNRPSIFPNNSLINKNLIAPFMSKKMFGLAFYLKESNSDLVYDKKIEELVARKVNVPEYIINRDKSPGNRTLFKEAINEVDDYLKNDKLFVNSLNHPIYGYFMSTYDSFFKCYLFKKFVDAFQVNI